MLILQGSPINQFTYLFFQRLVSVNKNSIDTVRSLSEPSTTTHKLHNVSQCATQMVNAQLNFDSKPIPNRSQKLLNSIPNRFQTYSDDFLTFRSNSYTAGV